MVTLVILDGFGLSKEKFGNAIAAAGTPHLDKLKKEYPYSTLQTSGVHVGLPEGQMGNSEIGHLTLGAGRVILHDLEKINHNIKTGDFYNNKQLLKAISHAKDNNSTLHILGLLSDGGVHSHINHLFAIIDTAKKHNLEKVCIHAITDGRDTPFNSGINYIKQLQEKLANTPYKIASIAGRVYTMDREKRYERVEKSYNMMVLGENYCDKDAISVISDNYKQGIYDEFIHPTLLDKNGIIQDGDSIIFYNFRSDRAIEITDALTNANFKEFKTKKFDNLLFSPMKMYSENFADLNIIYPEEKIHDSLTAIISQSGMKQMHIAETTKYAHVTFFFNGGIEKAYNGEERKLVESVDTQDFSYFPKMKAGEITEEALEAIASTEYDFIIVNYSNPDMVGHTGNFASTKEAIACVEKQAYALALATLMAGGDCIITADHGNAEYMIDKKGNKVTSHTSNPVPVYIVSEKYKKAKIKKNMTIANIAPTVLKMLNLAIPKTMQQPLF